MTIATKKINENSAAPNKGRTYGAIAQLGERLPCKQEVGSSILPGSTIYRGCSDNGSTPAQGAGRTVRVRHLLPFLGHVQQLSKTFYGKKNNRVPYFETLTAILKTILLEIEKSSPLTKHMPNRCGVVKNASRRSILVRSSDGRASDC